MSTPETPQLPSKPEVKQRPPVPTKPSNNTSDTSSVESTTSQNSGNVKMIVNKFSQPESKVLCGGTAKITSLERKTQEPPKIKPRLKSKRPSKTKSPSQTNGGKAPPLPPKTRSNHSGQKEEVESKEAPAVTKQEGGLADVITDGGQSGESVTIADHSSKMAEGLKRAFSKIKRNVFEAVEELRGKEGEEGPTERRGSIQRLTALITTGSKTEVEQNLKESKKKLRTKRDGNQRSVITKAPDGKEGGKLQAEQDANLLPEPRCEKNCSCVCHLQRPGMKLVWVPISEKEEDEGENDEIGPDPEIETSDMEDQNEKGGEEESEAGEQDNLKMEVESLSESVAKTEKKSEEPLTTKDKFQETRNLIEQQLRRKSDPGPPSMIASVVPFPQTPLNVPKAQSLDEHEESIYEFSLEIVTPPRPQKKSDTATSKDAPPAIPPRMPLDNRCSPRLTAPKPLARPASPLMPPTKSSPPASPRPQRAPPPPPIKAFENGRRLSSYSLQSIDENDSARADGEKCGSKEKPSRGPRRQQSIDLEAGMTDEYLYQFYTKTFISKEIRRTVCRNISKTSIDFQMDLNNTASSEKGAEGIRSSPIPAVKQNNLWRDQPTVRDSGVLQTLTPEQCKYQESMFEVITSEMSYLRSLRVLTEHFMESSDLTDTLIIRDKKTLFSNVLRIQEVSERFLGDLEERLDENVMIKDICDIIHYHAQHHFPAYIDYVRNQIYQEKTYTNLMQTNTQFAAVITRLQESPKCQRLPFMSFLLLPFQRITRIKMLIENILRRTAVGTDEEQTASKALDSVSKIIEECNTQVGKMKQVEELIEINAMLEFDKLKAVPIISQTRYLEKRGELQEVNRGGAFLTLRPRFTPVYLFLFNDLLVIATKKSSERYVVLDHAHRSLIQVQSMGEDASVPSLENCFSLTLLENHQGRHMERVLKAPTQSDLHRWLAVFPNPNDPNKDQEEVIYEDWDCPQVQCVEKYEANQADELNLEPTEIINVIRKTNEGWYEGVRLSDGQKGWFPVANVLEITNEHVRRRNLRERYRVIQAAAVVANKTRSMT